MPVICVSGVDIEVIRKSIKYMHLYVLPPDGRVRITAPKHVRSGDIVAFAASKIAWIRQKQQQVKGKSGSAQKQYVSGEMHNLWGQEYPLVLVRSGRQGAQLVEDAIYLNAPDGSTLEQREAIMNRWYRQQLAAMLPALFIRWETRIGVRASEVRIKNMRTRWGTCNPSQKRIWMNLQLAKKPVRCIEYVIVHELVHLIEKSHSSVFKMHMDRLLPDWRALKKELNQRS